MKRQLKIEDDGNKVIAATNHKNSIQRVHSFF